MQTVLRKKYFDISVYKNGLMLGFVVDDDDLFISFPFIVFRIKLWMIRKPVNPFKQ